MVTTNQGAILSTLMLHPNEDEIPEISVRTLDVQGRESVSLNIKMGGTSLSLFLKNNTEIRAMAEEILAQVNG